MKHQPGTHDPGLHLTRRGRVAATVGAGLLVSAAVAAVEYGPQILNEAIDNGKEKVKQEAFQATLDALMKTRIEQTGVTVTFPEGTPYLDRPFIKKDTTTGEVTNSLGAIPKGGLPLKNAVLVVGQDGKLYAEFDPLQRAQDDKSPVSLVTFALNAVAVPYDGNFTQTGKLMEKQIPLTRFYLMLRQ